MLDFFTRLLFEDFWVLVGVAVPIFIIALAIHRRRLTSRTRLVVGMTLGCFLLVLILQYWVVTDREAIEALIRALARAVDEGNVPVIGEHLDETFSLRSGDKQAFLDQVNQTLQRWHIDEAGVGSFKIDFADNGANVAFRAYCNLRSDNNAQPNVVSWWRAHCVRSGDDWKLDEITAAKLGPTEKMGLEILDEIH